MKKGTKDRKKGDDQGIITEMVKKKENKKRENTKDGMGVAWQKCQ